MESCGSPRRTVLLLGAGASRASRFELPTLQGLFDKVETGSPLFRNLATYFGTEEIARWDIEMILSHLAINASLSREWPLSALGQERDSDLRLYDEILTYVVNRLSIPQGEICDIHYQLFKKLGPETTIVSLNYDLVADQALAKLEGERGTAQIENRYDRLMQILQPSRTTFGGQQVAGRMKSTPKYAEFLKLHGSLDWFHCPNRTCSYYKAAFPQGFYKSQPLIDMTCLDCGFPLQVMLVPPTPTKDFNDGGATSRIWRIALEQFMNAESWIIAGTSLSPTDQHVRWLLKTAVQRRTSFNRDVVIVNPNKADRENIKRFLNSERVSLAERTDFASYLEN